MKKIILLTQWYPAMRGEQPFVEPEIAALKEKFQVEIFCCTPYEGNDALIPKNIKIHWQAKSKPLTVKDCLRAASDRDFLKEITLLIKKRNFRFSSFKFCLGFFVDAVRMQRESEKLGITQDTILYAFWGTAAAYGAARVKRKKNCKLAVRLHRYDLYKECNIYNWQPFKKTVDAAADRIFFIGDQGRRYYMRNFDIIQDPRKHKILRLGTIDHGTAKQNAKGRLAIVSCSYITAVKRVELIVDTIERLDIPVSWVHIGSGRMEEEVRQRAREKLDKKQNVSYRFAGEMSHNRVMQFYLDHPQDLLINLSASEGLPVSMMEALSFGVPVIGTNVGGVSEIIDNGVTGYLLPDKDPVSEAAEAIIRYAALDEQQRLLMSKRCRSKWETDFRSGKNAKMVCDEMCGL